MWMMNPEQNSQLAVKSGRDTEKHCQRAQIPLSSTTEVGRAGIRRKDRNEFLSGREYSGIPATRVWSWEQIASVAALRERVDSMKPWTWPWNE